VSGGTWTIVALSGDEAPPFSLGEECAGGSLMANMLERAGLRSSQNNLKPDDSDIVVVVALAIISELVASSGRITGEAGTGRDLTYACSLHRRSKEHIPSPSLHFVYIPLSQSSFMET
jgi:hypothetical protein